MWEKDRCDGKRKLKCNAVPTIFTRRSVPHNSPASSESCHQQDEDPKVNLLIASLTDEGEIKIDCQYQLHSDNIVVNNEKAENSPGTSGSVDVEEETDWKKRCEELTRLLEKSESECERLRGAMKRREELFNKIVRKSYKCGRNLKERLKKLRQQNQNYDKLTIRLKEIFNEDQMKALTNQGMSCREWSDDTIRRAIRLRRTCGSVGYQEILDQNIPLPSGRTLRRKRNDVELDEDI